MTGGKIHGKNPSASKPKVRRPIQFSQRRKQHQKIAGLQVICAGMDSFGLVKI